MTSTDQIVKCRRYDRLQVRSFNSHSEIALPGLFSRQSIPINYDHIPCAEMLDDWPHWESLRHKLIPKNNCEVGLLIGYDCSRALRPTDVISDLRNPDSPFGLKTDLGWSVMGIIHRSAVENLDPIGHSHRVVTRQITEPQIIPQRQRKRQKTRNKWTKHHCTEKRTVVGSIPTSVL